MINFLLKNNNKISREIINFFRFLSVKLFGIFDYNLEKNYTTKFNEYFKKNGYENLYLNLTNNLDKKSLDVINKVLERLLNYQKFVYINNLSKHELIDYAGAIGYRFINEKNVKVTKEFFSQQYPGLDDYEIPVFKFHHGLALLDEKAKKYMEGKDCIDAGAHLLDSAVMFSTNYKFNQIYSFELDLQNFKRSTEILKDNYPNLTNITSLNLGVWDFDTTVQIRNSNTNSSKIDKVEIKQNVEANAQVTKIDSFIKENNINNLGCIKMDIEGAEYNALLGAKESIKNYLPVMAISIYHRPKDLFEIKPLIDSFAPGEYDFYIRKIAPWYNHWDTYLICIPKKLNSKILSLDNDPIYG